MIYGSGEFNETLTRVIRENYRHQHYELTVALAKAMCVHVYGDKPMELLKRARPGEDSAITDYRIENFEPTTKAPCGKALKIVSRIFNPNLSSIVWPKDNPTAEELKNYTTYYYPVYNSLMVFNKDVTLKKMIADPNAIMAVKPQRIPRTDAEKVKSPIVVIYNSDMVWNYDLDHYLLNTSVQPVTGGTEYTFDYYDYEKFMRLRVKNTPNDGVEVRVVEAYNHNFVDERKDAEIPCWKLRGNSLSLVDSDVVYESFFADAQAHWNLSLIHESDVLGAFIKHMNPQRYVIGEECSHTEEFEGMTLRCHGGVLRGGLASGKGITKPCGVCNGTGKVATSPYENHIILKQKLDEMANISMDPIGYVKVPVDATKLLADRADIMVQRGNAAINMLIEDYVGANQSGIAKVYDRSAQSDTIYDIGCAMYDVHFQNQYYFINKYMNAVADSSAGKDTDVNLPQVNKPTRFNVETVAELVNEFREAAAAGVDRNFLQAKQLEILSRDLDTNPDMKKYYTALINLDPLFGMTQEDIDVNLIRGTVRKTDVVLHANLKPFVDKALGQDNKFLDLDKDKKLVILEGYANTLIASEKPKLDEFAPPSAPPAAP